MAQTQTTQTYYALRPFAHGGCVIPAGQPVRLHPKQAKYLLGSHLSAEKPPNKAAAKSTTKGDQ
ncbi:hypothetical protein [Salinisphaera orenii]|nr:hypothetical protein [Salinisphaera halophila]